jgi:hypothetical protein
MLGPVEHPVEVVEDQTAVVVDGQPTQLDAPLGRQHVPRDDVGVVLHLGEHHHVATVEVGAAPAVGDQVEGLGGVLGEHDLACGVRGADEPAHLGAGRLEAAGGLLGDGVHTSVDIGVSGLVVVAHGVEHGRGAL